MLKSKENKIILLPRPLFIIKTLEVSLIPKDQITNFINYKIKSFYPGNPDNTIFDFKILNFNQKKYAIIFISTKDKINLYKNKSDKNSLVLPFNFYKPLLNNKLNKNSIFLFFAPDWIDIFIINTKPLSSYNISRSSNLDIDLNKIYKIINKYQANSKLIIYAFKNEIDLICDFIGNHFKDNKIEKQIIDLLLKNNKIDKQSLFLNKKNIQLPPLSLRLFLYSLLLAAFIFLMLIKSFNYLFLYKSFLLDKKNELSKKTHEITKIINSISSMENEYKYLTTNKPLNIYTLLSIFKDNFPNNTIIRSLVINKYSFIIEGISSEPLLAEKKLKTNNNLKDIEITEIKPIPNSPNSIFRLKGVFVQ